ncbi:MAG: LysR family transcriptional regulator [Granulosicoccus sp.]
MQEKNWDSYRYILALYRSGTLSAAAAVIGVNETTISRRLLQLEKRLNAKLFLREQKGLIPTDKGMTLILRIERMELEIGAALEEIDGDDCPIVGTVRIAAPLSVLNSLLLPGLDVLLSEHPDLRLSLIATTAIGETALRDADVAVQYARPPHSSDVTATLLGKLACSVYAARDALKSDASGQALPWINYEAGLSSYYSRVQVVDGKAEGEGVSASRVTVNNAETLFECVRTGLGKSLMPKAFVRGETGMVSLLAGEDEPFLELWLTNKPEVQSLQRVKVASRWVAECIGKATIQSV